MKDVIAKAVNGGTYAALDEHAAAIRDLQGRVDELATVVGRVDVTAGRAAADAAALPDALRAAVDDLASRVAQLTARLDRIEGGPA